MVKRGSFTLCFKTFNSRSIFDIYVCQTSNIKPYKTNEENKMVTISRSYFMITVDEWNALDNEVVNAVCRRF